MPKVSRAHEEAVRSRIVEAALRVFTARGYHESTIQDVVRESGLSVGAIYTYFKGKDDLFLATCDVSSGLGLGELATRLAGGRTAVDKLAIAVSFFIDAIDDPHGPGGMAPFLVMQWARADQDPTVRSMLARRRAQLEAAGEILVREGMAKGDLPAWLDVAAFSSAFILFLDGLLIWRTERGAEYRREEVERRARALLEPLIAAAATERRPAVPHVRPDPWSLRDAAADLRAMETRRTA